LDIKDKRVDEFDELRVKFGKVLIYFKTDMSKEGSLTSCTKAVDFLGYVHGAFTSAGIAIDKSFVDQKWAVVLRIQEINFCPPFLNRYP
jgi:hypothetical protein